MRLLRALILIGAAAFLGTCAASLVLFKEINRASFVPLPFAVLGTAVIATGHGLVVQEASWNRGLAYALVLLLSAVLGAAMLGVPSGFEISNIAIGGAYGAICTACWIALDAAVPVPRTSQ